MTDAFVEPAAIRINGKTCKLARCSARAGLVLAASGFNRRPPHSEHNMCASLVDVSAPLHPGSWVGTEIDPSILLSAVKLDKNGLVPAIAQQYDTGEVLMMAWMNAESISETLRSGRAVYYSRSRQKLWRKGETSGQVQVLCDVMLDCDGDTVLLKVDQKGVACHTGRRSCFYNAYRPPTGELVETQDVLMDPSELYGPSS